MATEKNITMKQFNGTDYDTLYPKTITSQVDGLLLPQILATTFPNTEVTASLNGKTVSAMSDSSGLAILKIPSYGTWTLKATVNGIPLETPFVIDAVAVFNTSMILTNLEDSSWAIISSVANTGNAASVWSVGDKKTIKFNGVSYTAQIIGFNHDTKTTGGKAGITFQLVDCLNSTYYMNSSETNKGGWKNSAMRSYMSEFFGMLDGDLQSVIKAVDKSTSAGNKSSTIETVSDKLFLLSEVEIFGSVFNSFAGEGSQYDWYKSGNTKVKKVNGTVTAWWERSPDKSNIINFCVVTDNGYHSHSDADTRFGVSFGFCV